MARNVPIQDGPGLFDDIDTGDEVSTVGASGVGGALDAGTDSVVVTRNVNSQQLVIQADGGSRGNPGPAAYGAAVYDAQTGELLDSEGQVIGVATNNVAEYSGLVAGLEMARAINPAAAVEVRMDSKLVIEQMAGRWKIRHQDMKALAVKANALRPAKITWTWVPRSENKVADSLVNLALDGNPQTRAFR